MIKAYRISWGDYCALGYAESHTKARSMAVGFYTGSKEDEPYTSIAARRLPHMDNHPLAPSFPCIMDGTEGHENEVQLVHDSFVFRCWNCGEQWVDDSSPCECRGGFAALDAYLKEQNNA